MEKNKKELVELKNDFELEIDDIELDTEVNPYGVTATGCCKPVITD